MKSPSSIFILSLIILIKLVMPSQEITLYWRRIQSYLTKIMHWNIRGGPEEANRASRRMAAFDRLVWSGSRGMHQFFCPTKSGRREGSSPLLKQCWLVYGVLVTKDVVSRIKCLLIFPALFFLETRIHLTIYLSDVLVFFEIVYFCCDP